DDARANVIIEISAETSDPTLLADVKANLNQKVQVRIDRWLRLPHEVSREMRDAKRDRERANGSTANGAGVEGLLDTSTTRLAVGTLVKIIGEIGKNDTEMEAIVLERGFDTTFKPELVAEAERASAEH